MKFLIVLVFVSSIMAVFSAPPTTDRPDRKPFDEGDVFGNLENVFRAVEEEQKKLEETIRNQFQGLNNVLHVDPLFKSFDPSKVENKTLHDTRIVDGKVFETDEQVYSSGTADNGRIIHTKTVIMKPAEDRPVTTRSPSTDISTPKTVRDVELVNVDSRENAS
jgi:hypothetical protein